MWATFVQILTPSHDTITKKTFSNNLQLLHITKLLSHFLIQQEPDITVEDDDAFAGCSQEEDWMRSYVETDLRYIPSLQGTETGQCP